MSELKLCSYCKSVPQANTWTLHGISETRYFCPNPECPHSVRTVTLEEWQTRPIEDELRARIAELEAEKNILKDQQREAKNILIDKKLQIDSLYEDGYKLQQRIAELEAVVDKLIWSVEGRVEFMYSKHQREFEDIVAEYKEREG